MTPNNQYLALGLLLPMIFLSLTTATPASLAHRTAPDSPLPTYSCAEDPADCNRPFDASVYICENINFQPPCFLLRLDVVNDAEYDWQPNPFAWPSNLVGSWGPAPGIQTTLYTQGNENQTSYEYPGTTDVGDFWRENLWYFQAQWNPDVDPATLPKTVAAKVKRPGPTPTAGARLVDKEVEGSAGGRPWWIQGAER